MVALLMILIKDVWIFAQKNSIRFHLTLQIIFALTYVQKVFMHLTKLNLAFKFVQMELMDKMEQINAFKNAQQELMRMII